MLLAVAGSVRQLAERVGVASSSITRWRKGDRLPDAEQRDAIARELGIPTWAWDRAARTEQDAAASVAASVAPPTLAEHPSETTSAVVSGEMIALARTQLERVLEDANRTGTAAPSAEMRAKLSAHAVRIMELIAKMERDAEDLEGRAVRRSRFLASVVNRIVDALRPFPEASEAVETALEELDVASSRDEAA